MSTPTATPMTPRVWRINMLRDRVPGLLADVDAWRAQTHTPMQFSGVLCGHYARLFLSAGDATLPPDLVALLLRYIPSHQGSIAPIGVWLLQLEVMPILDEAALLAEVA